MKMHIASKNRNQSVKEILNGTFASLKIVVPLEHTISKPKILTNFVPLQFGVLIGITGDIRGKLVFSGEKTIIGSIGELMYGMPLEGDMLYSFGGELGNMIAGGLSTIIAESGFNTDIT